MELTKFDMAKMVVFLKCNCMVSFRALYGLHGVTTLSDPRITVSCGSSIPNVIENSWRKK
jgi:hypothetical protein